MGVAGDPTRARRHDEVEVPVRLRMGERSSVRLVRDTTRLLSDLWRIRHWSATGAYELAPQPQVASSAR